MNTDQQKVTEQYSKISQHYNDWFSSPWPEPARVQGKEIDAIFRSFSLPDTCRVLDLTCGIGTQSTGLAMLGHNVTGIDISEGQITKAREEAKNIDPDLPVHFTVGDASEPQKYTDGPFDVVISFGNSLPLLGSASAVSRSMAGMQRLLKEGGLLLVSMRDHSDLRARKPYLMGSGRLNNGKRQGVWIETGEWLDDGVRYISHVIFVLTQPEHEEHHYPFPPLAALTPDEFLSILRQEGYENLKMEQSSAFSFPVFSGRKQ